MNHSSSWRKLRPLLAGCVPLLVISCSITRFPESVSAKKTHGSDTRPSVGPRPGDRPDDAIAFHLQKRSPDGGPIDSSRYLAARSATAKLPRYSTRLARRLPSLYETSQLGLDDPDLLATWAGVGPYSGGRTRVLVVRPGSPDTWYAGAAGGGVWLTTNQGQGWTYTTADNAGEQNQLRNLSVNALGVIPGAMQSMDKVIAGTGEGYFGFDHVRGAGIFFSTDGGAHWEVPQYTGDGSFQAEDVYYINDIVVTPQSGGQYVYAATSRGTSGGCVFRSTNGGQLWTKIFDTNATQEFPPPNGVPGGVMDLAIRYSAATGQDQIFASVGTYSPYLEKLPIPPTAQTSRVYYCGTARTAPFHQTNAFWNRLQAFPATEGQEAGETSRTSLAIAPDTNLLYALVSKYDNEASGNRFGFYALLCMNAQSGAPENWTWSVKSHGGAVKGVPTPEVNLLTNTCAPGGEQGQGWYNNVVAVDPDNAARVWIGGVDSYRNLSSGLTGSWVKVSSWWYSPDPANRDLFYAHEDQHAIVFPSNGTVVLAGDGGFYRSPNRNGTGAGLTECQPQSQTGWIQWETRNGGFQEPGQPQQPGYQVTQFYAGAVFPGGSTFLGGTQDNGTLGGNASDPSGWLAQDTYDLRGDGGPVGYQPTDIYKRYAATTGRNLFCVDGLAGDYYPCSVGINESNDNFLFISPFAMSRKNPNRLWRGGKSAWRSTNAGATWQQAGATLITAPKEAVSAIAASPQDEAYVMMGSTDGKVFLSTNGGSAWTTLSVAPGAYISDLAFDPNEKRVAYATVSAFSQPHVLRCLDLFHPLGAVWRSLFGPNSSTPIDTPVNAILIDPADSNRLYIGTDTGIYTSTDWGVSWLSENTGFGFVEVDALALTEACPKRHLVAFTHGRGAYRTELPLETQIAQTHCATAPDPPYATRAALLARANTGAGPKLCEPSQTSPKDVRPIYQAMAEQMLVFKEGGLTPDTCAIDLPPTKGQNGPLLDDSTQLPVGSPTDIVFPFTGEPSLTGRIRVALQGDLDVNGVIDINDVIVLQNYIVDNVVPGVGTFRANAAVANANIDWAIDNQDAQLLQFFIANGGCLTPSLDPSCAGPMTPSFGPEGALTTAEVPSIGGQRTIAVGISLQDASEGEGSGLGGYLASIGFDPAAAEVLSVTPTAPAPFLLSAWTEPQDANRTGRLLVTSSHGQTKGPSGEIPLFEITFRVLKGDAEIVPRIEMATTAVRAGRDGAAEVLPIVLTGK